MDKLINKDNIYYYIAIFSPILTGLTIAINKDGAMNWFDTVTATIVGGIVSGAILLILAAIFARSKRRSFFNFVRKCFRMAVPRKPAEKEVFQNAFENGGRFKVIKGKPRYMEDLWEWQKKK